MNEMRKVYLDILNIIACYAVVVLHCTSKAWDVDSSKSWYAAIIIQGLFIWAVTIFFMLAGARNIDYRKKYSTVQFLKRRLGKIMVAFLLSSVFYAVFFQCTNRVHYSGVTEAIKAILNNEVVSIFWFFNKLIPLYFCIPIISLLNQKMKLYFVLLAILVNFLVPVIDGFFDLKLNQYVLNFANIIVAIALLGYLLDTVNIKKIMRIIIYVLGLICTFVSILLTFNISLTSGEYSKIYLQSTSFTTIMEAVALWTFVKYTFESHISIKEHTKKNISQISSCCFGVYLLQMVPLEVLRLNGKINVHSPYYSLIGSCVIFVVCVCIIYITKVISIYLQSEIKKKKKYN